MVNALLEGSVYKQVRPFVFIRFRQWNVVGGWAAGMHVCDTVNPDTATTHMHTCSVVVLAAARSVVGKGSKSSCVSNMMSMAMQPELWRSLGSGLGVILR
jgi:hypothetical protein